ANVIGGIFFGLGWAIVGYCPATAAGAVGEGRWDALFGILGMLAGAMAYAEAYPLVSKTILTWGNLGKITLPEVLGADPWWVIGVLTVICAVLFLLFEVRKA
ncbi:MAG TPA: YeeE/YedE thiosulfate transporter family protein, partial [Syntrophales bacterium]|nr:YeeE/YedE thiosulfate transporter family protein [Syntrophales bacterium]